MTDNTALTELNNDQIRAEVEAACAQAYEENNEYYIALFENFLRYIATVDQAIVVQAAHEHKILEAALQLRSKNKQLEAERAQLKAELHESYQKNAKHTSKQHEPAFRYGRQ